MTTTTTQTTQPKRIFTRRPAWYGSAYRHGAMCLQICFPVLAGMRKTAWIKIDGHTPRSISPITAGELLRYLRHPDPTRDTGVPPVLQPS